MKQGLAKGCFATLAAVGALFAGCAMAAETNAPAAPATVKNGTIGYVVTEAYWAVYQSPDGKEECPDGINKLGPREQFKADYPDGGTLVDTALKRESESWFPQEYKEHFPFHEAAGKIAIGLNLDGKVGPNDFTSPDGEKGIDNQLYRVIGCEAHFRGPDGVIYHFDNKFMQDFNYSRGLIEITGVDNLVNDPNVTVHIHRGLDKLMTDATGNTTMPGGTQHIDTRFGKKFEATLKGKIVNGVLTTEPADIHWPWSTFFGVPGRQYFRGVRFQLKLDPEGATGLMAGYADVNAWYDQMISAWSTHHLSYGQTSAPSVYHELRKLADGYPDKNGQMTAISSAVNVTFTQVYIEHPEDASKEVASNDKGGARPVAAGGQR